MHERVRERCKNVIESQREIQERVRERCKRESKDARESVSRDSLACFLVGSLVVVPKAGSTKQTNQQANAMEYCETSSLGVLSTTDLPHSKEQKKRWAEYHDRT